ncbi:MAG TPA: hypothetical protein DD381_07770 [Lentisphaeria bacterium]|nr:MAG: hypothetical protein A2X47_04335 [Lentisphaerae bacterium GWF2_38_69]HBM16219.1 hypothetical protein [Lentisphaeria bacterium]
MNWKKITLMAVTGTILCTGTFASDTAPTDLKEKRTFTGTVVYTAGGQIQFGFNDAHRGWVDYSARPGFIFRGPIKDVNGTIIREGDLLMHITDTYRVALVEQFTAAFRSAEVNLNYNKWLYEMAKKLEPTNSLSEMQVKQAEETYFAAIAALEGAKAQLIQAQQLLEVCTMRAQYDGIVDTVMVPAGYLAGEEPVMKLYEMNPIGINVALNSKLVGQMNYNTPITITSYRPGSEPVGIIRNGTLFSAAGQTGVTFQVLNKLLPPPKEAEGLPIFERWGFAANLGFDETNSIYYSKSCMMIMEKCLIKKGDSYFAWKVEGAKEIAPKAGMNNISSVKLVPITVGNFKKYFDNNTPMIQIMNSDISEGDVFLNNDYLPETLKDGDKVCLFTPRYTFMEGDVVTVEIGPNP